jgi:ABC-type phosphate/phosphonate transport system substrate-binding protein
MALPVSADLVFTAPPRDAADAKADNTYPPIAEYLSKVLGQKVNYVYSENWLNYQKDMRDNKYDIVFDGPHFISWRIQHLQHEALLRFPGPLDFVLVAKADDNSLTKLDDLVAKRFCSIAPPNLGSLVVLDKFRNPVRQPVVKAIRGGIPDVYDAFKKGECQAAVLRTNYFAKKLSDEERKQLKVLMKVVGLPNQGFTVGSRVSERDRNLLRQALSSDEGTKVLEGLIKQFAKAGDKLVLTNNKEYDTYHELLEGVIFGW